MPPPLVFSALYMVGLEYMDEAFRRFFLTDADATVDWSGEAFKQVYNRYFADEDYYLTTTPDAANLRPLIQTIDIVEDDELELSWSEFVEFQTGFPVRMPGAEVLSFKIGRSGVSPDMGSVIDNVWYGHLRKSFQHSVSKNHLAAQGAVLIMVCGNWSNPLLDGSDASGGTFDIAQLTNRDDWLIRSMDESDTNIGQLSASKASINLFEGGDIYIPDGTDTNAIDVDAGDVDVSPASDASDAPANVVIDESAMTASGAAQTDNEFWVESWLGASLKSDINFF